MVSNADMSSLKPRPLGCSWVRLQTVQGVYWCSRRWILKGVGARDSNGALSSTRGKAASHRVIWNLRRIKLWKGTAACQGTKSGKGRASPGRGWTRQWWSNEEKARVMAWTEDAFASGLHPCSRAVVGGLYAGLDRRFCSRYDGSILARSTLRLSKKLHVNQQVATDQTGISIECRSRGLRAPATKKPL